MAVVWIPPLVRDLTGGVQTVPVPGANVRQVLVELEKQFPGIQARLCSDDGLRPGISVVVDGLVAPLGLLQAVKPDSEVHFLPAIGGGEGKAGGDLAKSGQQYRPQLIQLSQ